MPCRNALFFSRQRMLKLDAVQCDLTILQYMCPRPTPIYPPIELRQWPRSVSSAIDATVWRITPHSPPCPLTDARKMQRPRTFTSAFLPGATDSYLPDIPSQ